MYIKVYKGYVKVVAIAIKKQVIMDQWPLHGEKHNKTSGCIPLYICVKDISKYN